MAEDLANAPAIDLARVELDYEGFRQLGRNPNLSEQERIGFPDSYRAGHEQAIFVDIIGKLPRLASDRGATVFDIGPGCAGLPRLLIDLCARQGHSLHLMDSPEMLMQITAENAAVHKHFGMFPRDFAAVDALIGKVDALLCYSVLHYIFVEANPFTFIDRCVQLLAHGGRALIGDIPNLSKRRRFFASPQGIAYHHVFTGGVTPPPVELPGPALRQIDDAALAGMVARAQLAGCDAYLLPQADALPMANRRDDLLLYKP